MSPPQMCQRCGQRPQAYHGRKLCYECKPGSRGRPLPCKRCGAAGDYWAAGLCRRCHLFGPQLPESCRVCWAWPVFRIRGWMCEACDAWQHWYPATGTCVSCSRLQHLNPHQACRLCWLQAKRAHTGDGPVDVIAGNRHGQQLMLAGLSSAKNGYRPHPRRPWYKPRPAKPLPAPQIPGQLDLFAPDPIADAARCYGFGDPPSSTLATQLDEAVIDHGQRHGWSASTTRITRVGMRVLLALTATTAPPVRSSDVDRLIALDLTARPVRAVLDEAGMLTEDRPDLLETWFEQRITGLPSPMAAELRIWRDVLYRGSTTPPRRHPRHPATVRIRLRWALPTLRAWAGEGHQSLREISRDQVIAALPASGNPRVKLGRALKSIFATLKARKVIFTNPAARIEIGQFERRIPLPADTGTLAAALNCRPGHRRAGRAADLPRAAAAELIGLQLTDIHDGRCYLPGRTVLLAGPVKTRLAAYLDYRYQRWPASSNPHLFIHYLSAPATYPVRYSWVNDRLGLRASAIRQDRILDEVIAAGGDLRRICDLFGVTIATAQHYTSVLGHPGLTISGSNPAAGRPAGAAGNDPPPR